MIVIPSRALRRDATRTKFLNHSNSAYSITKAPLKSGDCDRGNLLLPDPEDLPPVLPGAQASRGPYIFELGGLIDFNGAIVIE